MGFFFKENLIVQHDDILFLVQTMQSNLYLYLFKKKSDSSE